MKYACVESTEDFSCGAYRVRVWREEDGALRHDYPNADIHEVARKYSPQPMDQMAAAIAALPRVNAVQVIKGHSGSGIVLYNNW